MKQKVSLSQIDNLLLQVERFNPSLQERVLDLLDNPTQCVVMLADMAYDETDLDYIETTLSSVWVNRWATENMLANFKNPVYECAGCSEYTISSSILCGECWSAEDPSDEADHINTLAWTYEDMGITFFRAADVGYSSLNHFFTLR